MRGERGRVRELCDLGDRTVDLALARDAAREAAVFEAALARLGFLRVGSALFVGGSVTSFSLSEAMWISEVRSAFAAGTRAGEGCVMGRTGLEGLLERCSGSGGKGRDLQESSVEGVAFVPGDLVVVEVAGSAAGAASIGFVAVTSEYLIKSSPILALRRLIGMRLIRRSIRDRRSEA